MTNTDLLLFLFVAVFKTCTSSNRNKIHTKDQAIRHGIVAPKINAIADHGDDDGGEGVGQLAETKREVKNIQAESLFFSILELLQWNIHTEIYGSQILF